jgi:hypothetical protein
VHLVECFGWRHYNFNIHVSLATDTLYLLLKGLVMKVLEFTVDMLEDLYLKRRVTCDGISLLLAHDFGSA